MTDAGLQFENPIVAGETLVRQAIQSPDYVQGVSGWSINRDGSAEFNNLNLRGTGLFGTPGGQRTVITNTGIIQIYNSANQLVVQLDASGLVIQDPTTGAAASIMLAAGITTMDLTPPTLAGHTISAATFDADSNSGTFDAFCTLNSPQLDGGKVASVVLFGENTTLGSEDQVDINATSLYNSGPNTLGRGPVARAFQNSDQIATTLEAVSLTASQFTYIDGRAYRATYGELADTSNSLGRMGFRLRKTNSGGQLLGVGGIVTCQTGGSTQDAHGTFYFRNVSGANITAFIALSTLNFDGSPNTCRHRFNGPTPRWLLIEDCGDAISFDWATNLV